MRGSGALRAGRAVCVMPRCSVSHVVRMTLRAVEWRMYKKQKIRSRVLNIRREKCGKNASERTDGLFGPKKVNFDKIGNPL